MDVVMGIVVFPSGCGEGAGCGEKEKWMKDLNIYFKKIGYKFAICRKETITEKEN